MRAGASLQVKEPGLSKQPSRKAGGPTCETRGVRNRIPTLSRIDELPCRQASTVAPSQLRPPRRPSRSKLATGPEVLVARFRCDRRVVTDYLVRVGTLQAKVLLDFLASSPTPAALTQAHRRRCSSWYHRACVPSLCPRSHPRLLLALPRVQATDLWM